MKTSALAFATVLGFVALGGHAHALVIPGATITVTQEGDNVVISGSGEIDLAGLTFAGTGPFPANGVIWPAVGEIITGVGIGGPGVDLYTGASGPASMGSTGESEGDVNGATGDQLGWAGAHSARRRVQSYMFPLAT